MCVFIIYIELQADTQDETHQCLSIHSLVRSFVHLFVRFLTHQTNLPLGSALRSSLYGVLFVRMLVVKA